jgi:hypothetical protein
VGGWRVRLTRFDLADRIGEFYGNPETQKLAELLIDAEEDPHLRAVPWEAVDRRAR